MEKTVGWGIIGPGRIAKEFAESIKLLPDAKVVAVGSRSYERAKEFTDVYGGTPYGSYEEMVKDPAIDIVYVATPHPMHEEHVILSANAGKAVLCEKPFSVTAQEARNMVAAARANNVFMMEGLWSRFFPIWEQARKLIAEGGIGTLRYFETSMAWGIPQVMPENRLFDPNLAGGGLLDAGAYTFSAAFMLMSGKKPQRYHYLGDVGVTGVDENVTMIFGYENEVQGFLHCGLRTLGTNATRIVGDKGTIVVHRHRNPDQLTYTPFEHGSRSRKEVNYTMPYQSFGFQFEAAAVMDCYRKGLKECSMAPLEETIAIAEISEEIRHGVGVWYPFEKK